MPKEHDDLLFHEMCTALTMQARRINRYELVLRRIANAPEADGALLAKEAENVLNQESRGIPQVRISEGLD